MKENIKRFLTEKRELFIFVGVVLLVFGTVLGISLLASGDRTEDIVNTNNPSDSTTNKTTDSTTEQPPVIYERMLLPLEGDYQIVRYYFDVLDPSTMTSAVMVAPNYYKESTGVSYALKDGSQFDCLAVFSGRVIEVLEDSLDGKIVVIEHDNDVVSRYSALSSVDVEVNDIVSAGDKIGVAGSSLCDSEAGIHVHLELKMGQAYINPITAYDKELTEIASMIEK